MGDRYVKSDEIEKMLFIDTNIICGWAASQSLPYDGSEIDENVKLEDISTTPYDSDRDFFIECDLSYPDSKEKKTRYFHFCPKNNFT